MDQLIGEFAPIVPNLVVLVARHREESGSEPFVLDLRCGCFFARKAAGESFETLGAACIVRVAWPSGLLNVRP